LIKDPLGDALLNYFDSGEEQLLKVYSKDVSPDEYKASYFFRSYAEMPLQEQKALKLCSGKVLDAGAGAGCHSLWLKENGFDVTALDTSFGCVQVMKKQGLQNVFNESVLLHKGQYDTILLMMNGIGLAGKIKGVHALLNHLKSLLKVGGQILVDSSDILFLFGNLEADELLSFDKDYLGEVEFQFAYKKERGPWFSWLYLDERTFRELAQKAGFNFKIIYSKKEQGYLAQLQLPM